MTDDSTAAGALQPFELKPDENLLPRLGPWQPFRFSFCCPLENQLTYREANRDSVTEVRFPLQNLRYLRLLEGGDVSEELGSNQLVVVASASSARGVLGDLEVGSRAFTPQGDGVNDQLSIQYTLFRVQQASAVKVGIYALDGRRVWQAQPEAQAAGRHTARWDGRDGAGQLVGPGIYLARVEVETDKGSEIRLQPVAVAY